MGYERMRGRGYAPEPWRRVEREPTPEEERQRARGLARNMEQVRKRVEQNLGLLAEARTLPEWQAARHQFDLGLQNLSSFVEEAAGCEHVDAETAATFRDGQAAHQQLLAQARAHATAPVFPPPPVSCEAALLSALPATLGPSGAIKQLFDEAEGRVAAVLATVSRQETATVNQRLQNPADRLGERFARFAGDRRRRLLAFLHSRQRQLTVEQAVQGSPPTAPAGDQIKAVSPTMAGPTARRAEKHEPIREPELEPDAGAPSPNLTRNADSLPRSAEPAAANAKLANGPEPIGDVPEPNHEAEPHDASDHGAAMDQATAGSATEVPHPRDMERSFGQDFGGVRAHRGQAAPLAAMNAQAAARGDEVAFASSSPPLPLVAHELTHVLQHRGAGGCAAADAIAARRIESGDGPAEREADAMSRQVEERGLGVRLPSVTASPQAAVHRAPPTGSPRASGAAAQPTIPVLPTPLETRLAAALRQEVPAQDARALRERLVRLMELFRAVPAGEREVLRDRLIAHRKDDELASSFHRHLSPKTRKRLLAVLRDESVPLPAGHDSVEVSAFAAAARAAGVTLDPERVIVSDRSSPAPEVMATVAATVGPPADEPFVDVRWTVIDPGTEVLWHDATGWYAGDLQAMPTTFSPDHAGSHTVRAELVHGGVLIARLERELEVSTPASLMAAATKLSREERAAEFNRVRAGLAEADASLSHEARQDLGRERALLEFGAHQAGQNLDRTLEPPADGIEFEGMRMSTDPVFLRSLIEDRFIRNGYAGVWAFIHQDFGHRVEIKLNKVPLDQRERVRREGNAIIRAMEAQLELLRKDNDIFLEQYHATARQQVHHTLDESERKAKDEIARYGLRRETVDAVIAEETGKTSWKRVPSTRTEYAGATNGQSAALAHAAGELAASQREIDRMRERADKARKVLASRKVDLDEGLHDQGTSPESVAEQERLCGALERQMAAAEKAHQAAAAERVEKFPALANFRKVEDERVTFDIDGLMRLGNPHASAAELGPRLFGVLDNIARTRKALADGKISLWKEERVHQMTKPPMLVVPGTVRERALRERMAEERGGDWGDFAIMALTMGLALLAAIPTGGSSLAAGVVVVAEVGGAVFEVSLVADEIEEYSVQKAMAGTDMDKARALAAAEPSLFWLALDIVSTAVGLGAAAKSFEHVARARRLALAAADAAHLDKALAAIHAEHRAGHLSAEAAIKLEDEILGGKHMSHGAETAGGAADDAAAAERSARDPALNEKDDALGDTTPEGRAGRRDLRRRVTTDQIAELEKRLGLPVEFDESLTNGVELRYVKERGALGIGTDIKPTVVRVGRDALVDEILAHRHTVRRITRYNGLVGKLRSLWDELVIGADGTHNPFAKATRGWESFEEMRKLEELIALRRARWNPRTLDVQTLDDEIAFLEGRLAYHKEIVRAGGETRALKGVGHIDTPDIGKVTEEAVAKGYKLPGPEEGANPDWYYYRGKRNVPGEYELALKPSAPAEAKSFRAVTKDGRFEKLERSDVRRPSVSGVPQLDAATGVSTEQLATIRRLPGGEEWYKALPTFSPERQAAAIEEAKAALDSIGRGETVEYVGRKVPRKSGKGMLTEIDVETATEIIQVKGGDYSKATKLSGDDLTQFNNTRIYNEQMRLGPDGAKLPPKKVVYYFTRQPSDALVKWCEGKGIEVRVLTS